jgi:Protein of unknown function (DUF559)
MAVEGNVCRDSRGEHSPRSTERGIADLAVHQHGVVARRQLVALGLSGDAIDRRLRLGRLHPIHRGVFAVGHSVLSREAAWMAAVLAAGPEAVLSHRSAAALWGIRDTSRANVDVIAPRRLVRPRIDSHRITLPADETTTERGIRVTTVTRTLLDLAEVLTPQQLERAITEADVRRLSSPHSLDALVARHPGRRGTAAIERALENRRDIGMAVTRSELETTFLAFLETHGLPRPRTNARITHRAGTGEVDAAWPDHRLIVELDGYDVHTTRRSFEDDRARDRALTADGWRVVRITWHQLHRSTALAGELRTLLGRST